MKVKIEYSNRHIHLSKEVLEILFGHNYLLNSLKKLSQCDDFAAQEMLSIIGPKGKIDNVRIIGPLREKTQVEILKSDAFILGIDVPFRISGDLKDTPGIKIVSSLNEVNLEEGLIIAKRHLHISPEDAQKYNLKNSQKVKLKIKGERALTFDEIVVRVKDCFQTRVHLDLEEANAAGIKQDAEGEIIV